MTSCHRTDAPRHGGVGAVKNMMNMMMVAALLAGVMPASAAETTGKQKALPVPGEMIVIKGSEFFNLSVIVS
jgi:hypothetical protein